MTGLTVGGTALLCVVSVIGLGYVYPFGNPRVEPVKGLDTLLQDTNMKAEAKAVLVTKCADCHSNETKWLAYSRIAPGSWLIERDVIEGRKHLNLSHWTELSADAQQALEAEIATEAKRNAMPPLQYRMIHWGAALSREDVQALSTLGKSANSTEVVANGMGDAERGRLVFEKRCIGCHAMEVDREGPRLAGVFGRKAGSVAGFGYSAGLKNLGATWTDANLERWLSDPDLMVRDNNMSFSVPKAQERRDLIAYLKK